MNCIRKISVCLVLVFVIFALQNPLSAQHIILDEYGWSDTTVGDWNPVTKFATLNQDLNGRGIAILGSGIVLNGNGHTITGTGTENDKINGVEVSGQSHVTVFNLNITNSRGGIIVSSSSNVNLVRNNSSNNLWGIVIEMSENNYIKDNTTDNSQYGMLIISSTNDTLMDNSANSNTRDGIFLYNNSDYNIIMRNTFTDNRHGIRINTSTGNYLSGNTLDSNRQYGIYTLLYSSDNILTGNIISNNLRGIVLGGPNNSLTGNTMTGNSYNFTLWSKDQQTIDISNTVDGKPVYYYYNVSDIVVDASTGAGMVIAAYCNNFTVRDLTLTNNESGVSFVHTTNSFIENVTVSDNIAGILLVNSDNNTITGIRANSYNGDGIQLLQSDGNIIIDNTVSDNRRGIFLGSHSDNIPENASNNNNITDNIINNNFIGIVLRSASSNNRIYHNNFIDNETQAIDGNMAGAVNFFNLDAPVGGNFWSDWTSPDDNGDGFVDNPYAFEGGQDDLPWTYLNGWWTLEQIIGDLMADVEDLGLNKGNTNALTVKLENALKSLKKGKTKPAANKINAFINQVNAFISNGKISEEAGHELIDTANYIIARINSGLYKAGSLLPETYTLYQNYPNPFNPETVIRYDIPQSSSVSIRIYNILGKEIKSLVNESKKAGYHRVVWDGTNNNGIKVSSGTYIYRISAGDFVKAKKMVLVK
ncbi:NosD domain-containing protein [candidate division KSB1 bacterium]